MNPEADFGLNDLLKARGEIDAQLKQYKRFVTVMFTDLQGSTSFFEKRGDTAGLAWLEKHNQVAIPLVEKHGGTLVKTIGDAIMAHFPAPAAGVSAAVAIQRDLDVLNEMLPQADRMYVRIALHCGQGYLRSGDIFGDVVNVAARIVKCCQPAQILVSDTLRKEAEKDSPYEFSSVGTVELHGKAERESIWEVLWCDAERYERLRKLLKRSAEGALEAPSFRRYQILHEVGRGSMGVVYKAYDTTIGRVVALKTLALEAPPAERAQLAARLANEARSAGALDHPNIVTVYDAGEESGLFYVTMQFVEGATFQQLLAEGRLLPLPQILDLFQQICTALEYAHERGVIHRDLKPSNLMLARDGSVKVMDFGLAKQGDAGQTKSGVVVGTPSYVSPEQAGGKRVDRRSDIFSLGCVLYEMFTGEQAFPGQSTTTVIFKILNEEPVPIRAIDPTVPPALEATVKKCLAKDPYQRYGSCAEMAQDLRTFQAESAAGTLRQAPVTGTVPLPEKVGGAAPSPSRAAFPVYRVLAGALLLAALVGAVLGISRARRRAPVASDMVEIPGATFMMGRNDGAPEEGPAHPVSVASFYLDRTEVTNSAYARFVQATGHRPPANWSGSQPPAGAENLPVTGVSWADAAAFARWVGKRLPTESEWESAARGVGGRMYPWGMAFEGNRANSAELGQQKPIPVGSLPAGASPYGILDLAGNVWEWAADDYAPYPGSTARPLEGGSQLKTIRGGSFGSDASGVTTTVRSFELADHRSESIGFRCARSK